MLGLCCSMASGRLCLSPWLHIVTHHAAADLSAVIVAVAAAAASSAGWTPAKPAPPMMLELLLLMVLLLVLLMHSCSCCFCRCWVTAAADFAAAAGFADAAGVGGAAGSGGVTAAAVAAVAGVAAAGAVPTVVAAFAGLAAGWIDQQSVLMHKAGHKIACSSTLDKAAVPRAAACDHACRWPVDMHSCSLAMDTLPDVHSTSTQA